MKLSVIILNWNTRELLSACLASLERHPADAPMEVIVVDNGSTDGSPEAVRERFPQVRLIETGENLGFSGGNNVGLKAAAGEYRLLLNSDTEVQPEALNRMMRYMDRTPRAGASGAQLVYPDGRLQPSGSSFITLGNLWWEQLFLDRAFPRSPLFAEHFLTDWHYRETRRLDALSGACLMMRAECLREIGLLDTNYFMYCEDVDWCLRAARAGWERVFLPQAQVMHHHGASSRSNRPEMVKIYNRSRFYYFYKFYGEEAALEAKRILTLGARLRGALWRTLSLKNGAHKTQCENWARIAVATAALKLEDLPPPGSGEGRLDLIPAKEEKG